MHMLREVEKFLRETDMPRTRFGRLAVRDPRLVDDMRRGREPRGAMVKRLSAFMRDWRDDRRETRHDA